MTSRPGPSTLHSTDVPLAQHCDLALLDLDGVCFAGTARVPHAAEGVNGAREHGMALSFVTNNAGRAPSTVAGKLHDHGIEAEASEVYTAAMDGVALLAEHVAPGAKVLVVGGEGVESALRDAGYEVVHSADDHPQAVVQGWAAHVDWAMLSEGAYAIAAGALHVATNVDATLPTERGFALGNGSLVVALAHATGKPYLAAGKPFPGIYTRAMARTQGTRPVAVGDRLNTDLVGANSAGIASMHVLTGVGTARDVLLAPPSQRPTFLHTDLRGLLEPHPQVATVQAHGATWFAAGQAMARVEDGALQVAGSALSGGSVRPTVLGPTAELTLDGYRAAACACWEANDAAAVRAHASAAEPNEEAWVPVVTVPEITVATSGPGHVL